MEVVGRVLMFYCFDDCVLFFFLYWIWGELYTVHIWGRLVNGRSIDGVWTWTNLGGERGSPIDINYSMGKTFSPNPNGWIWTLRWFLWWRLHWQQAPPHISFTLSTGVNMEQAHRAATPFSFSLNCNISFCRRNQLNPLLANFEQNVSKWNRGIRFLTKQKIPKR